MTTPISPSTKQAGFYSAVLATVFSISYIVAQFAEWTGLLGSQGGPESASTPLGLAILLTPSLLLSPSFLVLVVSIHQLASPNEKSGATLPVASARASASPPKIVYASSYGRPDASLQWYLSDRRRVITNDAQDAVYQACRATEFDDPRQPAICRCKTMFSPCTAANRWKDRPVAGRGGMMIHYGRQRIVTVALIQ